MIKNCKLGKNVRIPNEDLVNLYGCEIGDNTLIGSFVEIQDGAIIGANCKIESHTFICNHVTIEDEVFIGHGVTFIDDKMPRASHGGVMLKNGDWKAEKTVVRKGASIGSGAVILPSIIGYSAMVGAGSVVTKDVRNYAMVVGNPAHTIKFLMSENR